MDGKHIVRAVMVALLLTAAAGAQSTAETYLESGRAALFDGTLSGIRQAAGIFAEALKDPDCADCPDDRELLFFHAVSRVAMWGVKDDPDSIQSGIELARAMGIDIQGDRIDEVVIPEPHVARDRYDRPLLPDDLKGLLVKVRQFRDTAMLPELAAVIGLLDRITETPGDPFVVWLRPEELQVFLSPEMPPYAEAIKVDYGDVLMLKGTLSMVKGVLAWHAAYDLHVSQDAMLLEKVYEDMFSIQHDLLVPHPQFLKLLPTVNDSRSGKAVLARVRQDVIAGLEAYIEAMAFVLEESRSADPGQLDNELFFVAPDDYFFIEHTRDQLEAILASLRNDTDFLLVGQRYKVFELPYDQGQLMLEFTFDALGLFNHGDGHINVDDEDFYFHFRDVVFEIIEGRLYGYADHGWAWGMVIGPVSGYFSGELNADLTAISQARFEYWGSVDGQIENLGGPVFFEDTEQVRVDLNPLLGSSGRYPNPVSPRNLLSEFGDWNRPVPGTIGRGLGNDPTLGGILPEMTHAQWNAWMEAQPSGKRDWSQMANWQISSGWPRAWLSAQLVFDDDLNDANRWGADVQGLDIDRLYLGRDLQNLYGSIDLQNAPKSTGAYQYTVLLSPHPRSDTTVGSLRFRIGILNGVLDGTCHLRQRENGQVQWVPVEGMSVRLNGASVQFKLPRANVPIDLSGRYLSVHSGWGQGQATIVRGDVNHTHLQIGQTASISGQVAFAGYRGGPIFVRAFTELFDPDKSLVAYTVLDGPGAFTLDRIGLGLDVFVEAFCPLFGDYHLLDMDALRVSTVEAVALQSNPVSGVVLELDVPPVLGNRQLQQGHLLDSHNRVDYYAFDAIAGATYTFEIQRDFPGDAAMTLLDRNGSRILMAGEPWQTWPTYWTCPVNGRYYVRLWAPSGFGSAYQLRVSTDLDCPTADISGGQWVGVGDCRVDVYDFALMAGYWMQHCAAPYWCQGSDLTQTGQVDLQDLSVLVEQWLADGVW